jgi:hypothetical protein
MWSGDEVYSNWGETLPNATIEVVADLSDSYLNRLLWEV